MIISIPAVEQNVIRVISEDGEHFSAKQCILTNADYPAECTNQVRDPKLFQMTDGTFRMVLGAWLQDDKGSGVALFVNRFGAFYL